MIFFFPGNVSPRVINSLGSAPPEWDDLITPTSVTKLKVVQSRSISFMSLCSGILTGNHIYLGTHLWRTKSKCEFSCLTGAMWNTSSLRKLMLSPSIFCLTSVKWKKKKGFGTQTVLQWDRRESWHKCGKDVTSAPASHRYSVLFYFTQWWQTATIKTHKVWLQFLCSPHSFFLWQQKQGGRVGG